MTKIKIAAVIVCMVATGAFAGFTYQAANNSGSADENVTVKTFSELTTDDETTSDETVTDEETTSDETTAEEDITVVTTAVTTKKADKKTEKASKKTTKTSAEEKKVEKKAASAPAVTTAPVVEEVPETVTEQYYEEPVYEEVPVYEEPEYVESEPVYEEQPAEETSSEEPAPAEDTQEEQQDNGRKIQVTDEEYIWLCNVVGHEYGANWISEYEKAKVVEVVMNRVNDPRFPNTIWGVLTQPNQFSGLEWTLYLGTYSYQVTPSVMAAVDMYLEHPEDFNHGYLGFWGDGSMNHFYSI
ncbi:MAG: cell wall hydrolase [Ruminococcus sp.]|uniref:cell wall hydrolase n=1 Tax=Ruminococcus sp. TaxID=41978 RepID=UPI0025CFF3E2|nr:cell wall hydrolase [Ruminococcus sp.]MBO4867740.1 cell wall hydrolase [Ruminococcus sp.]